MKAKNGIEFCFLLWDEEDIFFLICARKVENLKEESLAGRMGMNTGKAKNYTGVISGVLVSEFRIAIERKEKQGKDFGEPI